MLTGETFFFFDTAEQRRNGWQMWGPKLAGGTDRAVPLWYQSAGISDRRSDNPVACNFSLTRTYPILCSRVLRDSHRTTFTLSAIRPRCRFLWVGPAWAP